MRKIKVPRFECPYCGCRYIFYRGSDCGGNMRYHDDVQCLRCHGWYLHNAKDTEEVEVK